MLWSLRKYVKVVDCIVCNNPIPLRLRGIGVDMDPPTEACNHDRNVCESCVNTIEQSYDTEIDAGSTRLTCPDPECRATIPVHHVQQKVSRESFRAYV